MKALLDEQLSPQIAQGLRSRGLDVDSVKEREDLVARSDEELLEVADRESRALVTNNVKDFRPLAAERVADGRGHAGLILLPSRRSRTREAIGGLIDAIGSIMRESPEALGDLERWVPPP